MNRVAELREIHAYLGADKAGRAGDEEGFSHAGAREHAPDVSARFSLEGAHDAR
jgi:hypothetical protein